MKIKPLGDKILVEILEAEGFEEFFGCGVELRAADDLFAADDPAQDPAVAQTWQERDEAIEAVIKPIEENPQLRDELSDLLGERRSSILT